jgi:hypothetical protein
LQAPPLLWQSQQVAGCWLLPLLLLLEWQQLAVCQQLQPGLWLHRAQ